MVALTEATAVKQTIANREASALVANVKVLSRLVINRGGLATAVVVRRKTRG